MMLLQSALLLNTEDASKMKLSHSCQRLAPIHTKTSQASAGVCCWPAGTHGAGPCVRMPATIWHTEAHRRAYRHLLRKPFAGSVTPGLLLSLAVLDLRHHLCIHERI